MKRVIIFDPDSNFGGELTIELKKLGDFQVTAVTSLNDACLALIQDTQDLAFIPKSTDPRPLRSLLVLQSDIQVILTANESGVQLPKTISSKVQGILHKSRIETTLPNLLSTVFDSNNSDIEVLDGVNARNAIHTGFLGPRVQSALFMRGLKLITHWGELNKGEAKQISDTVSKGWTDQNKTTQVQFLRLPERRSVLLLYTRVIQPHSNLKKPNNRYLLTLISAPEVSLSWLRARADKLASSLSYAISTPANENEVIPTPDMETNGPSYAIAWRTAVSVPETRLIPLRRTLERIAIANACVLTHIDIQAQLIHLVVNCPPKRNSSWIAHILKSGTDEAMRQAYGNTKPLWALGHYARESLEPLSTNELNVFLARNTH